MGMQASIVATFDGIRAQSETDFTSDLKKIDVPTLIVHGADDQLVPIDDSAVLSARLIKHSVLNVYPGVPHSRAHIPYRWNSVSKRETMSFLNRRS